MTIDGASNGKAADSGRRRKVPLRTKLLFAVGALQEASVSAGGLCTVIYYNQVLGVAPGMVGLAFLIASVCDAVSDPLVGFVSDRLNSRWGRRHPFMILSALPIAICFFMLYQPMQDLGETGYFIWLTVFLVLMRLSQTFYLIPHDALGAELTDDTLERTSVFGYNSVAVMLTTMVLAAATYYFVFPSTPEYAVGFLNEPQYFILASVGAITITFSVLLCAFGTIDQIPHLHPVDVTKKFLMSGYFKELGALLKNTSYLSACISLLIIYSGLGIIAIVANYAYLYVYEFATEDLFWIGATKIPGVFIAMPLLGFLAVRFEKKTILMTVTLILATGCALPHFLRLLDLLPANDSPYLIYWVVVPMFLGYLIFPVQHILIDSQLVDIADDHELKVGNRSEGVVFSIRSFGIKATQGIGGLFAGFGLEFINFPQNAEAGNLSEETINGLLMMNGPLYFMLYLIAIYAISHYQLDKKRHAEILVELEKRRESAANGAA